jgi:hypothetical protein
MLAIMIAEQLLAIPAPIHRSHLPGNFQSSIFNLQSLHHSFLKKSEIEKRMLNLQPSNIQPSTACPFVPRKK